MLNPQSPIPLYRQLADLLLKRVRTGEYPPGSRIPSEHKLAATFGIGRPTARQAIELLVRKRVLEKRRGSGTYVRADREEVDLFSLAGTISSFHRKGISVTTHILAPTRLTEIDSDHENPFSGGKAFFLSRLSRVDETPVLIEDIYLHPDLFPAIDKVDLAGRSLSRIVEEQYYMRPTSGKQNFRIGYPDAGKALYLDISPATPILIVKRFLHFPQANDAIYAELYCRTDHFVFSQTIGGFTDE